jgi:hypothetical protein
MWPFGKNTARKRADAVNFCVEATRAAFGPYYGGGRLLAAIKGDPYVAGYMLHRILSFAAWAVKENGLYAQDINPIMDNASARLFKDELQDVSNAMSFFKADDLSKSQFAKGTADAMLFNDYLSGAKDIHEHPLFDRIVKHAGQVASASTGPRDFFTEYIMAFQYLTFGRYWQDNYPRASLAETAEGWT